MSFASAMVSADPPAAKASRKGDLSWQKEEGESGRRPRRRRRVPISHLLFLLTSDPPSAFRKCSAICDVLHRGEVGGWGRGGEGITQTVGQDSTITNTFFRSIHFPSSSSSPYKQTYNKCGESCLISHLGGGMIWMYSTLDEKEGGERRRRKAHCFIKGAAGKKEEMGGGKGNFRLSSSPAAGPRKIAGFGSGEGHAYEPQTQASLDWRSIRAEKVYLSLIIHVLLYSTLLLSFSFTPSFP